jgi:hypothetical protein
MECYYVCRKCYHPFDTIDLFKFHDCLVDQVKKLTEQLSLQTNTQSSPSQPTLKKLKPKRPKIPYPDTSDDEQNMSISDKLSSIEANRIQNTFLLSKEQALEYIHSSISVEHTFQMLRYIPIQTYISYLDKLPKRTPIEERFVLKSQPIKDIDMDEISNYLLAIQLYIQENIFQKPFQAHQFTETILSPLLSMTSVWDMFNKIFNKNSNIVFMTKQRANSKYGGCFYFLEKVEDSKRYWRFDDKLNNISSTISSMLTHYMIQYFRKLYFNIFHDYTYHKDYLELSGGNAHEFKQLLHNLKEVCYVPYFIQKFSKLIESKCQYFQTESDKFLGKTDEKEYAVLQDEYDEHYKELHSQLFDNYSD